MHGLSYEARFSSLPSNFPGGDLPFFQEVLMFVRVEGTSLRHLFDKEPAPPPPETPELDRPFHLPQETLLMMKIFNTSNRA